MNNNLDRIESHLRALIEEKLMHFFSGSQSRMTLVDELIQVMQENLQEIEPQVFIAPDKFILQVMPEDLMEWQANQDILNEIAELISKQGENVGIIFHKKPSIDLSVKSEPSPQRFTISAYISPKQVSLPDTAAMAQEEKHKSTTAMPENAFLVIGGADNISLEKPIINIGRHSTNDIVLDDPHISRHHVQLRAIKKHFVVFDVGSTGGTFLNEKQISQATLQAGDVIRIGRTNLIFIQDTTSAHPTTVTPIDFDEGLPGGNH